MREDVPKTRKAMHESPSNGIAPMTGWGEDRVRETTRFCPIGRRWIRRRLERDWNTR